MPKIKKPKPTTKQESNPPETSTPGKGTQVLRAEAGGKPREESGESESRATKP